MEDKFSAAKTAAQRAITEITAAQNRFQQKIENIYGIRVGQVFVRARCDGDMARGRYTVVGVSAFPEQVTRSGPIITVRYNSDEFDVRLARVWRDFMAEFKPARNREVINDQANPMSEVRGRSATGG